MKTILISLMVMFSTQVHADSIDEALNKILGVAFQTGCLRYGNAHPSRISHEAARKYCEDETVKYKEELSKLNPGSKIQTSDGTEVTW